MKLYNEIQKANINLRPLGIEQRNDEITYYCTPENANIIGWAGVDGIHYCTISQFGEMIFTVNPMNFGDCVHPIAHNFEDLLRLLLSVADMAVLEQCYAWDEEQFKAFLIDNPATDEQNTVLDRIRMEWKLEPMEDAFSYVKKLQAEFDLSKIPYTEDYYDVDMNPSAPERDEPWEVYFDGGFFGKRKSSDHSGEEFVLNAQFTWNHEIWHIPAVYIFSKGIVADFCVEIAPEQENDNENPLNIEFRPHLTVNGKMLRPKYSTATSWIPANCLPNGVQNDRQSARIIKHYGLDETRAWSFHRTAFLWATAKKPTINSMSLKLEREAAQIDGICFKNPSVGDVITFTHPVFGTEHKLTVVEHEPQELSSHAFADHGYEFPTHHIAMTYTLKPDIPDRNFQIRDRLDNDEPKRRPKNGYEPQATDACAISIIGGADGPTAIILSDRTGDKKTGVHAALSALHFEPANDVEWKMVFREKLVEDMEVDLLA